MRLICACACGVKAEELYSRSRCCYQTHFCWRLDSVWSYWISFHPVFGEWYRSRDIVLANATAVTRMVQGLPSFIGQPHALRYSNMELCPFPTYLTYPCVGSATMGHRWNTAWSAEGIGSMPIPLQHLVLLNSCLDCRQTAYSPAFSKFCSSLSFKDFNQSF